MERTLFKCIVGSHAFGTQTKDSDTDIAEIFVCDRNDLLGFKYKEHDDIDKDNRRYEIGKFLKLLMAGNPNMLEILNSPDDCVLETSPEFELLRKESKMFITKALFWTFIGYANTQIVKARGLNKKINWENSKVERKTVLDFCYVYPMDNPKMSSPLREWLGKEGHEQSTCGLQELDHFRYGYLLYLDNLAWVAAQANHRFANVKTHEFKGIVSDEDTSNDVCLSTIPEYSVPNAVMYFNKDGYSTHCRLYGEYMQWKNARNEVRYKTNKVHGQNYDSKNIMHMVRLLNSADRIFKEGKITVRVDEKEREYLLKVKSGQENLEELVKWSENKMNEIKQVCQNSNLPDGVDTEFCHNLLVKIRNYESVKTE